MTKIWECLSFVKVPVEGSNEQKWVLMISSGHRQKNYLAMQYFVGDFDGTTFTFQKQNEIGYAEEGKGLAFENSQEDEAFFLHYFYNLLSMT